MAADDQRRARRHRQLRRINIEVGVTAGWLNAAHLSVPHSRVLRALMMLYDCTAHIRLLPMRMAEALNAPHAFGPVSPGAMGGMVMSSIGCTGTLTKRLRVVCYAKHES